LRQRLRRARRDEVHRSQRKSEQGERLARYRAPHDSHLTDVIHVA
jgi:hypothetical protein